jgi:ABC-2 type transport system ATP-binding protein
MTSILQEQSAAQVASQPAITVDRLTKRYGDKAVVDDLSFSVPRGVVTGFLGPNGSGKTTTIRMIFGLVHPSSGRASVAGRPFADLAEPARHAGLLIDGAGAHPRRTARNHLRVVAAERAVAPARVDQVLDLVGLSGDADRKVKGYSLGMRQRLDLATALLAEPELLVLDEPANGLDPAGIRWLRDFLRSFAAGGGTVFVSSHQLAEISQLVDEVVVIDRGRLVTHTAVGQLTSAGAVKVRAPRAEVLGRALAEAGARVRTVDGERLEVCDLPVERIGTIAASSGTVLYELTPSVSTLEDVFLQLTTTGGEPR